MMTAGMATGFVGRFMVMQLLIDSGIVVCSLRVVTGMDVVLLSLLRDGMVVAAGHQRCIGRNALQGQGQHQQPGSKESNAFHEVEF